MSAVRPEAKRAHVDVEAFQARHEVLGLARHRFYQDVDAGRMAHCGRHFSELPLHVKQFYLTLAKHERENRQADRVRVQNRWYHRVVAWLSRLEVRS